MTADAGEDVEKYPHSSIAGEIVSWDNHSGNQFGGSLENWILDRPEDPAIPLLGIYPEDVLTCHKNICSTTVSYTHLTLPTTTRV